MRVYEKVRAYMDDKGFQQVAVAQKAKIPIATFSAMMNGRKTMYVDELRAICRAMDVSPETFIEFRNE